MARRDDGCTASRAPRRTDRSLDCPPQSQGRSGGFGFVERLLPQIERLDLILGSFARNVNQRDVLVELNDVPRPNRQ